MSKSWRTLARLIQSSVALLILATTAALAGHDDRQPVSPSSAHIDPHGETTRPRSRVLLVSRDSKRYGSPDGLVFVVIERYVASNESQVDVDNAFPFGWKLVLHTDVDFVRDRPKTLLSGGLTSYEVESTAQLGRFADLDFVGWSPTSDRLLCWSRYGKRESDSMDGDLLLEISLSGSHVDVGRSIVSAFGVIGKRVPGFMYPIDEDGSVTCLGYTPLGQILLDVWYNTNTRKLAGWYLYDHANRSVVRFDGKAIR